MGEATTAHGKKKWMIFCMCVVLGVFFVRGLFCFVCGIEQSKGWVNYVWVID